MLNWLRAGINLSIPGFQSLVAIIIGFLDDCLDGDASFSVQIVSLDDASIEAIPSRHHCRKKLIVHSELQDIQLESWWVLKWLQTDEKIEVDDRLWAFKLTLRNPATVQVGILVIDVVVLPIFNLSNFEYVSTHALEEADLNINFALGILDCTKIRDVFG